MKIPSIRVLSPSLELLAEFDAYTSLQYTRVWQGVGEFEFHLFGVLDPTILTEGNLILLEADGQRAGIIRSVQQDDGEGGTTVTVKGQTLNGLAAQRTTLPLEGETNGGYDVVPALAAVGQTPDPVAAETILKTYAARHLTSPLDTKRKIPGLVLAPDLGRGMKTVWMSRFEPLNEVLQAVGEYTDMGWEIRADLDAGQLVFDTLPGVDRTDQQSTNSAVIFSLEFESAESLSYLRDVSGHRNLAYAGGAGEGASRTVLKVTNDAVEPEGLARFETFIDCGTLEIVGSDTAMSLEEEGKHKLLDYPLTESLTATLTQGGSFLYRQHWDLGDLVTVLDRALGVAMDMRVAQVTERYEAGSYGVDVTFGEAPKHLGRVIRSLKNTVR